MVIAVILSLTRLKHPKWEAKSPITAVSTPIQQMDEKNAGQPFKYSFMLFENQPGQIQFYVTERNDMLAGREVNGFHAFLLKKKKGGRKYVFC